MYIDQHESTGHASPWKLTTHENQRSEISYAQGMTSLPSSILCYNRLLTINQDQGWGSILHPNNSDHHPLFFFFFPSFLFLNPNEMLILPTQLFHQTTSLEPYYNLSILVLHLGAAFAPPPNTYSRLSTFIFTTTEDKRTTLQAPLLSTKPTIKEL